MAYTPVQRFSGKPLKIAFKAALEGGKKLSSERIYFTIAPAIL